MRVVGVRVPEEVFKRLEELARDRGVSVSDVIREALSSADVEDLAKVMGKQKICFTVSGDFYVALKQLAEEKGVSIPDLIKQSLIMRYDFLRKYVRIPKPPEGKGIKKE